MINDPCNRTKTFLASNRQLNLFETSHPIIGSRDDNSTVKEHAKVGVEVEDGVDHPGLSEHGRRDHIPATRTTRKCAGILKPMRSPSSLAERKRSRSSSTSPSQAPTLTTFHKSSVNQSPCPELSARPNRCPAAQFHVYKNSSKFHPLVHHVTSNSKR